jgi:ribosomal protein S4
MSGVFLSLRRSLAAPRALHNVCSNVLARSRWSAATFRPPAPPAPPPTATERFTVLFPRQGSFQASVEVKRRVLASTPHMGAKRLKRLVRMHGRLGNRNSFIADLESRLDRFLYRCNAVPSIFAARFACGHGHVMVNGRVVRQTHRILEPGDIVEPAPKSVDLFKRFMKRRLANNTFVFQKDGAPPTLRALEGPGRGAVKADRDALLRDGAAVADSYRRLPLPRDPSTLGTAAADESGRSSHHSSSSSSSEVAQAWPAARQAQLDAIVPAVLGALAADGCPLAAEMATRRGELSVRAAAQPRGAAAPQAMLAWTPSGSDVGSSVLTLNRGALRRLLLGLLAVRNA